jgi:hypothetical protein
MKKRLPFLALILLLSVFSCKKYIEKQTQNAIIQAMTSGHWYVEQYKADTVDITGDFFGYEFQFYENGSVDGLQGTMVKSSGTWSADVNSYTITSAFPIAAGDTLTRLNYTWKITDSYVDYVVANTTTSNGQNILHLRKKP